MLVLLQAQPVDLLPGRGVPVAMAEACLQGQLEMWLCAAPHLARSARHVVLAAEEEAPGLAPCHMLVVGRVITYRRQPISM